MFVYGWKPALLLTGFYLIYLYVAFHSFADLIQAGPAYTVSAMRQIVIAVVTYFLSTAYFDWQLSRSQRQLSGQLQAADALNQKLAIENVQKAKLSSKLEESLKNLEKKNQSAEDIRKANIPGVQTVQPIIVERVTLPQAENKAAVLLGVRAVARVV